MRLIDMFFESVESLFSDKLRTFLSTLGVAISVSSIIVIQVVGHDMADAISEIMFSKKEGNEVYISIRPSENNYNVKFDELGKCIIPEDVYFTDDLLLQFEKAVDCEMQRVYSYDFMETKMKCPNGHESMEMDVTVVGCTQSFLDSNLVEIERGHAFEKLAENEGKQVAIISDRFSEFYFGDRSPIGEKLVIIDDDIFVCLYIIGVYHEEVQKEAGKDVPTEIYIPIEFVRNYNKIINYISDEVMYKVANVADFETLRKNIYSYFEKYFCNEDWEIFVELDIDDKIRMNQIIQYLVRIVTVIGFLAYLIGGMCIVNMMRIIVDEKMLEIGVRKAIGAKNVDIYKELLLESFLLVSIGVCFGILLGCLVGFIITVVLSNVYQEMFRVKYFSVPWKSLWISVVLAFIIGLMAAIGPVKKVKKMTVSSILREN